MIPKYYALVFPAATFNSYAAALETKCSLKVIAIPQNNIYKAT